MIRKTIFTLALLGFSSPAFSLDLEELNPKALQEAAVEATNAEDENLLLEIMQEMQRREMLFFKPVKNAQCEREPDKSGYFETAHPFHHGAAKQWYFMKLREIRLNEQSCECLGTAASFDELLEAQFGVSTATMTQSDFFALRDDREENTRAISIAYSAFHKANCRGE